MKTEAVQNERKKRDVGHVNEGKCKITVTNWLESWHRNYKRRCTTIEMVEVLLSWQLCAECDKDCQTGIDRTTDNSVFGRMKPASKNKHASWRSKWSCTNRRFLSTVLYSAELWPLSVMRKKKSEAAHHKFHWRYEEVGKKTALQKVELIVKEARLRRFGHVSRINDDRLDFRNKSFIGRRTLQSEGQEDQERTGLTQLNKTYRLLAWRVLGGNIRELSGQRRLASACGPMCLQHGMNQQLTKDLYTVQLVNQLKLKREVYYSLHTAFVRFSVLCRCV